MSTTEIKQALNNIINNGDKNFVEKIYKMVLIYQKTRQKEEGLKPFTQEEFLNRVKKSDNDYISGNYKTQKQIEENSLNW